MTNNSPKFSKRYLTMFYCLVITYTNYTTLYVVKGITRQNSSKNITGQDMRLGSDLLTITSTMQLVYL